MDAVTGFLAGPRARDAFLLRVVFDPPFAVQVEDDDALTLIVALTGDCWLLEGSAEIALRAGDVALVRGGGPYVMTDDPATRPLVVVANGTSRELDPACGGGENLCESMDLGVRSWGNAVDGRISVLVCSYSGAGEVGRGLLDALPRIGIHRSGEWDCPALPLLDAELHHEGPGQQLLLDRLLDVVTITAVRAELERSGDDAPRWFSAGHDPIVGRALRLLEQRLEHPWTVTELAETVGLSRAALARRFTDLLGEPPMTHLTRRRLALAADLLADPSATVGQVSRRVGYASPFTFSAAFKRAYGVSPSAHREPRSA